MKTISFLTFLLSFTVINTLCQSYKYEELERIKIDLDNVIDICINNQDILLLSNDSLYRYDFEGNLKEVENTKDLKGLDVFENKTTSHINSNGQIFNNLINIEAHFDPDEIDPKKTNFLAYNGLNFYSCYFDPNPYKSSWSNRIIKIDKQGNIDHFSFIPGKPSGLHLIHNELWLLTRLSIPNNNGIIIIYNLAGKKIIEEHDIQVIDPIGLYIDNFNNVYTYSTKTKEIVKLQIQKK